MMATGEMLSEQSGQWEQQRAEEQKRQARQVLRDEFAKAALPEILNKRRDAHGHDWPKLSNGHRIHYEVIAREVYLVADAMLRARGE